MLTQRFWLFLVLFIDDSLFTGVDAAAIDLAARRCCYMSERVETVETTE